MQKNENAVPESITERIKKLLAVTTEAGATQAEAESAALHVQKLLLKYNLELESLDLSEKQRVERILREVYDLNPLQSRHEAEWVRKLFSIMAKFNLCTTVFHPKGGHDQGHIALLGTKFNIDIVYHSVIQLISKYRTAEKDHWKNYFGELKRNTFRRGFFIGCIEGLVIKLNEQKESLQKADEITGNNQMVVLFNNNAIALRSALEAHYPHLSKSRNTGRYSGTDSRQMGRNVGRNTEINKGIGSAASRRMIG